MILIAAVLLSIAGANGFPTPKNNVLYSDWDLDRRLSADMTGDAGMLAMYYLVNTEAYQAFVKFYKWLKRTEEGKGIVEGYDIIINRKKTDWTDKIEIYRYSNNPSERFYMGVYMHLGGIKQPDAYALYAGTDYFVNHRKEFDEEYKITMFEERVYELPQVIMFTNALKFGFEKENIITFLAEKYLKTYAAMRHGLFGKEVCYIYGYKK